MLRIVFAVALALCTLSAPARALTSPQEAASESAKPAAAVVNLNTATQSQLESLPGIGPRTAERIIEYRQKNGGFKKIEELMNVKGIGEKSFLKLKARVAVGTPKA